MDRILPHEKMADAVNAKMSALKPNESKAVDFQKAFASAVKKYIIDNTIVKFANTMVSGPGVADPLVAFTGTLTDIPKLDESVFPSGMAAAAGTAIRDLFALNLQASFMQCKVAPLSSFEVKATAPAPHYLTVAANPIEFENFSEPTDPPSNVLDTQCKAILDALSKSKPNPLSVAGTHLAFTGTYNITGFTIG